MHIFAICSAAMALRAVDTSIRAASRIPPSRRNAISSTCVATSKPIQCVQGWSSEQKTGSGQVLCEAGLPMTSTSFHPGQFHGRLPGWRTSIERSRIVRYERLKSESVAGGGLRAVWRHGAPAGTDTEAERCAAAEKVAGTFRGKVPATFSAAERPAGDLCGLERDHRELIGEFGLELVVARLGQVALRLDHQEARRHANFEPPLLRIDTLLGERAALLRGLDPLTILFEPQRGIPHLTDGNQLDIAHPCLRLIAFQLCPGEIRLLDALPKRITDRESQAPGRKISCEDLIEDRAKRRALGPYDCPWKPAGAYEPRPPQAVRVVHSLQTKIRQRLILREQHVRIADLDLLAR